MDTVLSILAFLLAIIGIAGCIIPILPGVILSYAGLLCAFFTSYSTISTASLFIWLGAVLLVSLADWVLPAWITRHCGGSRAGAVGATVGLFVGFFLIPPIGILLGTFAGAVIGELLHDSSNLGKALWVGCASFLAFIVGTGLKLAVAIGILIHIAADAWPVVRGWFAAFF